MNLGNIREQIFLRKQLILKFINYYLFTILSAVLSFVSVSYLTYSVSTIGYGYLGLFTSIAFLLPSLLSFNSLGLIQINIVNQSYEEYVSFRNNFLTFCISLFLLSEVIVFSLLLLGFWIDYSAIIQYSIVYAMLMLLATIHSSELIQKGKATLFGLLGFLTSALTLLITYILVSIFNLDWQGRIIAFIASEFFFLLLRVLIFSDIYKKFKWQYSAKEWRYFIVFGLSLLGAAVAGWVINQSDRFVLLHFLTLEDVGVYSAGASISGFVVTINSTMVKVFAPIIYKALNEKREKTFFMKIFKIYSIIILCISLVICFFVLFFLPYFFGQNFLSAKWIICILTIAQAFFGMYQIIGSVMEFKKTNMLKSYLLLCCAVLCILFSVLLIPYTGILAPAIGSLLAFIMLSGLSLYFTVNKVLK